jgi:1-acyl-sn-glycerol-3-phosphate acyltransferase
MTIITPQFAEYQGRYWLPRFIYRDVLARTLLPILVKREVRGRENIPATGPAIFMINHIAAVDPMIVMVTVHSRFLIPFSKIENLDIPVAKWLIRLWGVVPVRRGEVDRLALQVSLDLLKRGYGMVVAPEGTRSPALQEAKDGITYLATKTNAVIIPVGVEGTKEFLPNLKRLRRTPMSVSFGRPFRFRAEGDKRLARGAMSRMTQEAMYQLAALLPEHRRGFYGDLTHATTETLEFVTPT